MRLVLALCLTLAVVVVTVTPASAEPAPGFGSWLDGIRGRIQNVVDKYRPRILEIAGTYNSVRDTWSTLRDLFRGRRSTDGLEYSAPASVDARDAQLTAELDSLLESMVAEVITGTLIDNEKEHDWSNEKEDISKEDHGKKEDHSKEDHGKKEDHSKEDHGKKEDHSKEDHGKKEDHSKEDHGKKEDHSEEEWYHPKALAQK